MVHWWNDNEKNKLIEEKPVSLSLCPPRVPYELSRHLTRNYALRFCCLTLERAVETTGTDTVKYVLGQKDGWLLLGQIQYRYSKVRLRTERRLVTTGTDTVQIQ
jgi:hypothetical protein